MSLRDRSIITFLLAVFAGVAPVAATGFFAPTNGPDGRKASDVAAAPDGDVYAASGDFEMYVLRVGADEWSPLPSPPGAFRRVQVGPDGSVWAFGWEPTFFSTNEGASWQVAGALPLVNQMEFDLSGRPVARTLSGLYRSDDAGTTWAPIAFASQNVTALAVDGASCWATVGTTLHRSIDSGANWAPVATLPLQATAVAAHPDGGVYIGLANSFEPCTPGGIFRVTNAGLVSSLGLEAHTIQAILVQPDGDVLLSVLDACSFHMSCSGVCNQPGYPDCGASGVYRSTDAVATWTLVTNQEGVPGKLATRTDGTVFTASSASACDICVEVSPGMFMSPDAGVSWVTNNDGLARDATQWVSTAPTGSAVWAANRTSAYFSTDHGTSWTSLGDQTPVICAQVLGTLDFESDGVAGYAYQEAVGVHRLLPGNHSVISFSSPTLLDMVTTPAGGLVATSGSAIFIAPTPLTAGFLPFGVGPSGLYELESGAPNLVAGTGGSSTHISLDGGFTWPHVANVAGELAFAPDGHTLYIVQTTDHSATLWRSRSSNNWVPEGVSTFPIASNWIADVVVDGVGAVYVLEDSRIRRLSSGATSWVDLGEVPNGQEMSIAADGYLYIATPNGVWRSAGTVGSPTDAGNFDGTITALSVGPNPMSSETRIAFHVGRNGAVQLGVYDVRGRLVDMLIDRTASAGAHQVMWRPEAQVASGVYVYRLRAAGAERSGRIVVVRP